MIATAQKWGGVVACIASIIGLLMLTGVYRPAIQTQSTDAADKDKVEIIARISKEEDARRADTNQNIIEHKEIMKELKEITNSTYRMHIQILERFDNIGLTPNSPGYRRRTTTRDSQ